MCCLLFLQRTLKSSIPYIYIYSFLSFFLSVSREIHPTQDSFLTALIWVFFVFLFFSGTKSGVVMGPNFIDEIDCGSFFDHIDDLLDFPGEDIEAGLGSAADSNSLPTIWPTQSESLPGSESVFSGNSSSDLSAELSVPVSNFYLRSLLP